MCANILMYPLNRWFNKWIRNMIFVHETAECKSDNILVTTILALMALLCFDYFVGR